MLETSVTIRGVKLTVGYSTTDYSDIIVSEVWVPSYPMRIEMMCLLADSTIDEIRDNIALKKALGEL